MCRGISKLLDLSGAYRRPIKLLGMDTALGTAASFTYLTLPARYQTSSDGPPTTCTTFEQRPLRRPASHSDRCNRRRDFLLLHPTHHHFSISNMSRSVPNRDILLPRRIQPRALPTAIPSRSSGRARVPVSPGRNGRRRVRAGSAQLPRTRTAGRYYGDGPVRGRIVLRAGERILDRRGVRRGNSQARVGVHQERKR